MQIHNDFLLKNILWYKIGGIAKYLIECKNKQDIIDAVNFIQDRNIKNYQVIGLGANLLFSDDYFNGAVLYLTNEDRKQIKLRDKTVVEAYAGELIADVGEFAFDQKLVGLEWSGGLPGTIGAGVRGNVGAFGGEFKDSVEKAEIINVTTREIKTLNNKDLKFAYRHSIIKENRNLIVLSATFELKLATDDVLKKARLKYAEHSIFRQMNHPHDYPNSGSCFKNVTDPDKVRKVLQVFPDIQELVENKWHGKVSVGYLNNRLGFSGFRIGNAQVSQKHGNFINNLGDAKQKEVVDVILTIQNTYQQTFGFTPEPEVEIVK